MLKNMKMSTYNFVTQDNDGNLILYNFLTGLTSLTKIMKNDVEKFRQIFLDNHEISATSLEKYTETVGVLRKAGILVDADIDENILYDAKIYDEAYENKLALTIHPTGKCNFKCPYCFENPQHFHREDMTKEAQNTMIKFVQKEIPNHKALHVAWFGGEPLVAPEIIKNLSEKFIQICKIRHIPYYGEIVTNGYLLDEEMFDMLYKLKVYQYMITIDGFKEQHDKQRFTSDGKGTYETIMNNLLKIRDNKKYKFAQIRIRVNMSNSFLDVADEFLASLAADFADDPRFDFMFIPIVKFSDSKFADKNIAHDSSELFKRLFQNESYKNKLCPEGKKISSIIRLQSCDATKKNAYVITSDLKVHKCNAHYDFDLNKIGKIGLNGDLQIDETIHKRWYLSKRFVEKMSSSCESCYYKPCCARFEPGCPTSYLKKTPDNVPCPLENEDHETEIANTVRYAASKYPCTLCAL